MEEFSNGWLELKVFHETQLPWPAGRARNLSPKNGPFRTSLSNALSRVESAVSAFTKSGRDWRTKRLTIYLDGGRLGVRGQFLSQSEFRSAAAIVQFDLDGARYTIAADAFSAPDQNLCGIAAFIEAVRAQERNGVFTPSEMLTNFAALPEPSREPEWAQVLRVEPPYTESRITAAYHRRAKVLHPDTEFGDEVAMTELNLAYRQAKEAISK